MAKNLSKVVQAVRNAVLEKMDIGTTIEQFDFPVFTKTADGFISSANQPYRQFYASGEIAQGRDPNKFLDPSVIHVSKDSDSLIRSGCTWVEFIHFVETHEGYQYQVRTTKQSLIELGCTAHSLVGISIVEKKLPKRPLHRRASLENQWETFSHLNDFDKNCFALLGLGKSINEIAQELKVNRKKVENHRKKVFHLLEIENNVEAGHLLCHFQFSGLADFGLH